jgi:transcriptional regulator with XRE-family HTH domain
MARYRVQELAEAQEYDISKLARRADLNYNTVAGIWHNKTKRADLSSLEAIANVLGTSVSNLIDDEPDGKAIENKPAKKTEALPVVSGY